MKLITIKKTDLAGAFEKIRKNYALTGPVKDKDGYIFRLLQNGEMPDFGYNMTRLSPKAAVFPQAEPLFALKSGPGEKPLPTLEEISFQGLPGAVAGIRPYDAKALHLLKLNFDTPEFKDPYFIRKFETLTLVGLAENHPDRANFSTSCGTGPFDETYLDILLVDIGDEYAGKILTAKGEAFAACAGWEPAEAPGLEEKIGLLKTVAEAQIESGIDFSHIRDVGIQTLYDAPFWKDLAFSCINCSTCTFACPTCWCFDIQDETGKDKGLRLRLWDSCMSDLYSAHASGHNPRSQDWQRFRNRFMHKLKYFTDKYNQGIMCVGCGRCIRLCPAGIDIRNVCAALNQKEAS